LVLECILMRVCERLHFGPGVESLYKPSVVVFVWCFAMLGHAWAHLTPLCVGMENAASTAYYAIHNSGLLLFALIADHKLLHSHMQTHN
jgi:hypothetical protein